MGKRGKIAFMREVVIIRAERKAKATELLGEKCAVCGSTRWLEFDHINRDRKDTKHLLSQMWRSKWDNVVEELKKCQLLCKSCHAKKSQTEQGHIGTREHGLLSTYENLKCRCDACRKANAVYMKAYKQRRKLQS
jgi:hypothetical protein